MKAVVESSFIRMFVCALMLVSLFTVLQISSSSLPSANADISCSGVGPCLSTEASVTVGGGASSNDGGLSANPGNGGTISAPVTIGPGGVANAPSIPLIKNPDADEYGREYYIRVTFNKNSPCAPKTINGFVVESTGSIWTERQDLIGWDNPKPGGIGTGMAKYGSWYNVKTTCVYPPPPKVTATNMTCIISYSATVNRLAQSYSGAAQVRSTAKTISSKAQLESQGQPACKQNAKVGLGYNPLPGQKGWGQYVAKSNVNKITCNFATTTFDGAVNRVGKCGTPKTVAGTTSYMTIWCNGFTPSLVLKDWTGSDCQNTTNARLNCVIPSAATYAGFSGSVQGLRDGKDQLVRWGTPKVTGTNAKPYNWRSSTVVNAGSTPRNNSGDNNKSKQLFASSIPFSKAMKPGQNLNQNLRFYTAGSAGAPFSMTRDYRFDATFNAIHTVIQSMDLVTGKITTSNYVESATALNNKCGPQQSPKIDVVRAIGDSVVGK